MAHVVVKGATYSIGDRYFTPGATECHDEELLAVISAAARELPWLRVDYHYREPASKSAPVEEPKPALPTPGQKLIAETDAASRSRETAAAKIAKAEAPAPTKAKPGHPCPYCDRVLKNPMGLREHVRHGHKDRYAEFSAQR